MVVVTWRSAGDLRRLVGSMNRHLEDVPELVVVDNDSPDDPEGAARAWRGRVRFIRLDTNEGYGAAANIGVAACAGDAVVILNPDTELIDASLADLARLALEHGGLAGPRLLDANRSIQPSASGPPVGVWPWLGALIPGAIQPAALKARTEPWRLQRTTRVSWLTGACIAGSRSALEALGPFDPAIHLYSEDLDLGLRAERAGIPSWFCPDVARIVHFGDASSALRFPDRGLGLAAANRRAAVRRLYGARRERAAWLAQRANLRLRLAAKAALGRPRERDRAALRAVEASRRVPELPPLDSGRKRGGGPPRPSRASD